MDDPALLRYSRHLLLNEIGIEGQERINQARVLVIGAGGLGAPASIYLAAAGVGRLILCDGDNVDLTNLQRQILHTTARVGMPKVASAALTLGALNPLVHIDARNQRLGPDELPAIVRDADVVLDCSDNRATRYAINRACVAARVPLVAGAATAFAGQLIVLDLRRAGSPCYACLFPEGPGADEACATMGVFAPLTGVIGALQAGEALRLLCGFGPPTRGRLLSVDARDLQFHSTIFGPDPACPVCGSAASASR